MFIKQLILLGFGASLLLLAVRRLRQYRLKERYTLLFFFIALPLFLLSLWPGGVAWVAHRLDIEYYTVALLGVTALFSVIILELLSLVSVQDRKITTLAQMVGILMEKYQGEQAGEGGRRVPTEEEIAAVLGKNSRHLRGGFKGTKPVIMSISEDPNEDGH